MKPVDLNKECHLLPPDDRCRDYGLKKYCFYVHENDLSDYKGGKVVTLLAENGSVLGCTQFTMKGKCHKCGASSHFSGDEPESRRCDKCLDKEDETQ